MAASFEPLPSPVTAWLFKPQSLTSTAIATADFGVSFGLCFALAAVVALIRSLKTAGL